MLQLYIPLLAGRVPRVAPAPRVRVAARGPPALVVASAPEAVSGEHILLVPRPRPIVGSRLRRVLVVPCRAVVAALLPLRPRVVPRSHVVAANGGVAAGARAVARSPPEGVATTAPASGRGRRCTSWSPASRGHYSQVLVTVDDVDVFEDVEVLDEVEVFVEVVVEEEFVLVELFVLVEVFDVVDVFELVDDDDVFDEVLVLLVVDVVVVKHFEFEFLASPRYDSLRKV